MSKNSSGKAGKRVRMPATKFGHLQKRMRKSPKRVTPKTKK